MPFNGVAQIAIFGDNKAGDQTNTTDGSATSLAPMNVRVQGNVFGDNEAGDQTNRSTTSESATGIAIAGADVAARRRRNSTVQVTGTGSNKRGDQTNSNLVDRAVDRRRRRLLAGDRRGRTRRP